MYYWFLGSQEKEASSFSPCCCSSSFSSRSILKHGRYDCRLNESLLKIWNSTPLTNNALRCIKSALQKNITLQNFQPFWHLPGMVKEIRSNFRNPNGYRRRVLEKIKIRELVPYSMVAFRIFRTKQCISMNLPVNFINEYRVYRKLCDIFNFAYRWIGTVSKRATVSGCLFPMQELVGWNRSGLGSTNSEKWLKILRNRPFLTVPLWPGNIKRRRIHSQTSNEKNDVFTRQKCIHFPTDFF
jgi:hypothetical protein